MVKQEASKMHDIVIKEYDPEDRNACVELLKRTFPGTSDEGTFRWRYEGINEKTRLIVIAKYKSKVISFISWIPWQFSYNNNNYTGYQAGEAATDIDFRRRGIWSKLLKFGYEITSKRQIDFLFGFPSDMSYGSLIRTGYYRIGTYHFYVRPINPFKKKVGAAVSSYSNSSSYSPLCQTDKITPVFNHDYCKWRYLDNPFEYETVEYTKDNGWALFVLRKKKWKLFTELLLLDCQFNSYNKIFVRNSIRFLDDFFSRKAVYMRTFFNQHTHKGRALLRHFPMPVRSKFYIPMVKPLSKRLDNSILLNINCWDIMPHCVDEL